jgi:hypothetical protein
MIPCSFLALTDLLVSLVASGAAVLLVGLLVAAQGAPAPPSALGHAAGNGVRRKVDRHTDVIDAHHVSVVLQALMVVRLPAAAVVAAVVVGAVAPYSARRTWGFNGLPRIHYEDWPATLCAMVSLAPTKVWV